MNLGNVYIMFSITNKAHRRKSYCINKNITHKKSVDSLKSKNELTKPIKEEKESNEKKKFSITDFDIGKPLGHGTFGNVYLAKLKGANYVCALKIIFKTKLQESRIGIQIQREVDIQSQLNHPNILKLFGFFEDIKRWFLVLEYCKNGELSRLLQQAGRFDERTAARYVKPIAEAIAYCHSINCIHRDLKPENIMIDHNNQVKLADFGLSVQTKTKRKTYCGTLEYLSPELVEGKSYEYSIDDWAIGVLTFELCTGSVPFYSSNKEYTVKKICHSDYNFPIYLSEDCKDFIRSFLVIDPNKRLKAVDCLNHPWIIKNTTN
ncbi:serine threonine protein kinase 6 putative [Entamoeba histolytica]|uniref:Aurora kinase n=2 Tax=Entamoeba histolytica TaxID=5759 RepID=C4M110_ENTH1|nr:serine/threonine- protein kinase Eg2-like, putative [Entamoeba histolytica HM-1:IMSS]EAL48567.1 serine/threonine- protein kinase Eg2-like, putative [Entamoeba histolytica HM-1:IMSS]GAT94876.1 serine threonine protein kinase 6 putative [Entamoeba histolytica]|eukprot:XP_653953.1 serine/threonine- protein kinase Eg2-like, putative [Entamoeba histolytica HM-1:IMSS]